MSNDNNESSINLPQQFDIETLPGLHQELLNSIEKKQFVSVNCGGVKEVDTAAIQWLWVLIKHGLKEENIKLEGDLDVVSDAFSKLGLNRP